jgi:hypothetical protein
MAATAVILIAFAAVVIIKGAVLQERGGYGVNNYLVGAVCIALAATLIIVVVRVRRGATSSAQPLHPGA